MRYRKRNPDGTFGEPVETPGHAEGLPTEIQLLYETIAYMDAEMSAMREDFTKKHEGLTGKIASLEAELQAWKGGGQ
ncbi:MULTISPECIES: hypothetical protein [Bacillales]|uniref:hypothetical protein n=1 Tax=Bacillales TaxID=1385 RepID=UPI0003494E17|nr:MULTISPECIES: hypothetical protein [Bacillales]KMZ42497.1 hypothetical protein AC624_15970 [Bacillus sp. FJAT-27238]